MSNKKFSKERVPFTEAEVRFIRKLDQQSAKARTRFPLLTALFATFGFVLLLDGFQKIIESNEILADNPLALMAAGFVILVATGTIYKKLN